VFNTKAKIKTNKWIHVAWAGFFLLMPFFMLVVSPQVEQQASLCPSQVLWGVRCMGCGLGKSIAFFEHGQWDKSFHYHPLGFVFTIVLLVLFIKWTLEALGCSFNYKIPMLKPLLVIFITGIGAYHIYMLAQDIQSQGWQIGQRGLIGQGLTWLYHQVISLL
jgi:Protein of unknown function (DUF2752)